MADGLHLDGQNDAGQKGSNAQNGIGQGGQNGTAQNGTAQNGTTQNGTTRARVCTCEFPKTYTGDDGEVGKIKRILKTETLQMDNGARYTRLHVCGATNPNEWREVIPPPRPSTPPKHKTLWVVRQRQIGKNPHWSLFAALDNDDAGTKGRVWQVNGDPDVGMFYAHCKSVPGVALFISASFLDNLLVCKVLTDDLEARVDEIANSIPPPGPSSSPASKDKVRKLGLHRGTCRTWVWEVLDRLVEEGITTPAVAAKARELQPTPTMN